MGDRQLLLQRIAWAAVCLFASSVGATGFTPAEELDALRRRQATLLERAPDRGEKAAVRATFIQLEKKYPRDPAVKNACAEFLWSIDDRDGAMARWREAAALDGKNAIVLNHLGGGYLASGEIREAYHFFTLASDADPANALYHFNAANVAFLFRHDLGGTEEKLFAVALKHFADASRLAPADPEYARAYAEAFYSVPHPDWRAALVAWTRFRELSANKDFAFLNLARVHMKLGEKENARACLAEVKGAEFAKLRARLAERIETE